MPAAFLNYNLGRVLQQQVDFDYKINVFWPIRHGHLPFQCSRCRWPTGIIGSDSNSISTTSSEELELEEILARSCRHHTVAIAISFLHGLSDIKDILCKDLEMTKTGSSGAETSKKQEKKEHLEHKRLQCEHLERWSSKIRRWMQYTVCRRLTLIFRPGDSCKFIQQGRR